MSDEPKMKKLKLHEWEEAWVCTACGDITIFDKSYEGEKDCPYCEESR
jgi:rubrerythrin